MLSKKFPKTKRSKENHAASLWSVCFFWEGEAERLKNNWRDIVFWGNATSRAKGSTYVTDDQYQKQQETGHKK